MPAAPAPFLPLANLESTPPIRPLDQVRLLHTHRFSNRRRRGKRFLCPVRFLIVLRPLIYGLAIEMTFKIKRGNPDAGECKKRKKKKLLAERQKKKTVSSIIKTVESRASETE